MRAKSDGIVFFPFVADPHVNEVLSKNITLEQEIMILFQTIQRFAQAARHVRNSLQFFGRQLVDVFVQRFTGFDFVLNAVNPGQRTQDTDLPPGRAGGIRAVSTWDCRYKSGYERLRCDCGRCKPD